MWEDWLYSSNLPFERRGKKRRMADMGKLKAGQSTISSRENQWKTQRGDLHSFSSGGGTAMETI